MFLAVHINDVNKFYLCNMYIYLYHLVDVADWFVVYYIHIIFFASLFDQEQHLREMQYRTHSIATTHYIGINNTVNISSIFFKLVVIVRQFGAIVRALLAAG